MFPEAKRLANVQASRGADFLLGYFVSDYCFLTLLYQSHSFKRSQGENLKKMPVF